MDLNIDIIFDTFYLITSRIGYLFYLVNPTKCMFENVEHVPRYVEEMLPVFMILAFAENGLRLLKGKSILRANDTIASISQGLFQECIRLKLRSFEVLVYCIIWDNYRIFTMQWNSHLTWWTCFLGVDLGFYIFHRLSHEVNLMWSVHQAHHSAEDFTMISSLRQAALQPFTAWFAYLPLALFIPPPIFLTHLQLSELYMIWIHTEVIDTLGPLELILNTPSHHRVHHGRNRKYIDKNFGGTLIIWDRLFGTFQAEDIEEPVAYGLVHPVQSYNPFYLQFHLLVALFQNIYSVEGWKNKLSFILKGPGWAPGKPRLGQLEDVPILNFPINYWSPKIPLLNKIYAISHFALILIFYHLLSIHHHSISQTMVSYCIIALLFSITSIGLILENRKFGLHLEVFRCIAFLYFSQRFLPLIQTVPIDFKLILLKLLNFSFGFSAILCTIIITINSSLCLSFVFYRFKHISQYHRKMSLN